MFDIKKEIPSLELCKKLKELGYPQDSGGWYWVKEKLEYYPKPFSYCPYLTVEDWCGYELDFDKNGFATGKAKYCKFGSKFKKCPIFQENVIKAPTVRELGEQLPCYLPELRFLHIERNEDGFHYYYDEKTSEGSYVIADTEANARAGMLIWLVEKGYVSLKKESRNG